MIIEGAVAAAAIGLALLIGTGVAIARGNRDETILLGVALLTGISPIGALIMSALMAIAFLARGDSRKAAFSLMGLVFGLGLFVGVMTAMAAGGLIE